MKRVGWTLVLGFLAAVITAVNFLAVECFYETTHRIVFGKAIRSKEAIFEIPDTSSEIVLERRAIHPYLAEYERTIVFRNDAGKSIRREVAVDTGGYSRMNVFQVSPTEYFLCGDLSFDRYFLDITNASLNDAGLKANPANAKFVGAFDRDENRNWRFISVYEKGERTGTTCQSGGITEWASY